MNLQKRFYYTIYFIFILSLFSNTISAKLTPTVLRCEYMINPTVVDQLSPRLSWINEVESNKKRGISQRAYRIVVSIF